MIVDGETEAEENNQCAASLEARIAHRRNAYDAGSYSTVWPWLPFFGIGMKTDLFQSYGHY